MSLPKELLEQLLTGYLDDALSDDERTRVEQLLQSNPTLVDELAELRSLRQSLKAVSQADAAFQLDSGFADRVLGAAVARARDEGLSEDHPLVRLAEQPSTTRDAEGSSSWRVAGVLVALAASIAIAVITLRPKNEPEGFAVVEPNPSGPVGVDPVQDDGNLLVPDVIDPVPEAATPEMIADAAESDAGTPGIEMRDDPLLEQPGAAPSIADVATSENNKPATPETNNAIDTSSVASVQMPLNQLGAIFVLHVQQTEAGRQSNAVAEAMELADIQPATEKAITDEIAGLAGERPEDGEPTILYLRAPAKQLDKFYLRLMADEVGVESVGITIADGAPIMGVISAVQPDPTLVRHTSLELTSESGLVDQLAGQLGQLSYLPMNRRQALNALPSNGPDQLAQILVLVQ